MNLLDFLVHGFSWCADGSGMITVFKIIKTCLNVVRIAVPIILIVMTVLDISKNVINPDEKDSMGKIGNRIIAAVIVFLVPTIVNLVVKIADVALGNNSASSENSLIDCWTKATK